MGSSETPHGNPITDHKQAVAVMLSEKRAAENGKTEYQSPFMKAAAKRSKHAKNS